MIKKLFEEKRLDRLEIIRLEKKVTGLELENTKLDKMSQNLHITSELRGDRSSMQMNTRRFHTEESDAVLATDYNRILKEPEIIEQLEGAEEVRHTLGSDNTINNSTIKENPFEVKPSVGGAVGNGNNVGQFQIEQQHSEIGRKAYSETHKDGLQNQKEETFHQNETSREDVVEDPRSMKEVRLVQEFIVIGLPSDIKENLKTFPSINPVELIPKLQYSFPQESRR